MRKIEYIIIGWFIGVICCLGCLIPIYHLGISTGEKIVKKDIQIVDMTDTETGVAVNLKLQDEVHTYLWINERLQKN